MNILAFDTATTATAARSSPDDAARELRDDPATGAHPGHATRLLPMADELLSQAGIDWDELDLIAVGTGPGGFTGLRVGVATARGVAMLARARPRRALESRGARARGSSRDGRARALALIDARRGEVFAQQFEAARTSAQELSAARRLARGRPGGPADGSVVSATAAAPPRTVDVGAALVPDADSTLHRCRQPARRDGDLRAAALAGRSRIRARARRDGRDPMTQTAGLQIRNLDYSDLPQVMEIERRSSRRPGRWRCSCSSSPSPAGSVWRQRSTRRETARRVPDLRALRHGMARDERRRRSRTPKQGRGVGDARELLRARR